MLLEDLSPSPTRLPATDHHLKSSHADDQELPSISTGPSTTMDESPAKRPRMDSISPPSPSRSLKRPTSTRPADTSPRIPFTRQDSYGSHGSRTSHTSHHPPILPPPTGLLSPSVSLPALAPGPSSTSSTTGAPSWANSWSANRRSMDIRDMRQLSEIRERGESRDLKDRDYRDVKEFREGRDVRSPSSAGSPEMDDETISTETGMVFARDTSSRAPRSMMACTRCRRQK